LRQVQRSLLQRRCAKQLKSVCIWKNTLEGNILLLCAKQVGIPGVNSAVLKVNEGFKEAGQKNNQ
jgi:hypothetical protein